MHLFDFFRDIISDFGVFSRFFGVKFGFRKSCQCKRNDKYEVCPLVPEEICFWGIYKCNMGSGILSVFMG